MSPRRRRADARPSWLDRACAAEEDAAHDHGACLIDAEYVVPVRWERTASPQRPLMDPGLFSKQNTAVRFDPAKPVHARTLEFLHASFPVTDGAD